MLSNSSIQEPPASPPCSPETISDLCSRFGCQPFCIILNRLPQQTLDLYCRKDPEDFEDEGEEEDDNVNGVENGKYEMKIQCIDLDKLDLPSLSSSSTTVGNLKASRLKLDSKIFCLFNLEEFDDHYEAVQTFYRELRYAPFRCAECDEATVELKGIVDHYIAQHPTMNKAYYWIEGKPTKEHWVYKFINYQIDCNNEEDDMFPNQIINKYCPVCNHFDYLITASQPASRTRLKVSNILDLNHINKHLRYNPYECILCQKIGRRYAISSINKKAQEHLVSRHDLEKSISELKTFFKPTATIPELENFLREYIGIIQTNERATAKPIGRRKPLTGKSNRQNGPYKGKQYGQLYKQVASQYKRIRGSHDSGKSPRRGRIKVIEYREEEFEDFQPEREECEKFLCLWCSELMTDVYLAWAHYCKHLKYFPITCSICNKQYATDVTFRYHGIDHVEHSDLPFTRNCDEAIETWGHEFLDGLISGTEAKPEFAEYCPVCEKIFSKPIDPTHINVNTVKSHIYSHLKYHPYECIPCKSLPDKKTFLGDLGYQAALHLNSVHSITVTPSEISNYFIKSRGIEHLDELLRNHFAKIQYLIGTPSELSSHQSTSTSTSSSISTQYVNK